MVDGSVKLHKKLVAWNVIGFITLKSSVMAVTDFYSEEQVKFKGFLNFMYLWTFPTFFFFFDFSCFLRIIRNLAYFYKEEFPKELITFKVPEKKLLPYFWFSDKITQKVSNFLCLCIKKLHYKKESFGCKGSIEFHLPHYINPKLSLQ